MKKERQVKKRQEQLVEEIGLYFEKGYNFSPLMARIYTLLILCPHSGYTFDEIVEFTSSSKSSVSTNLNMLIEKGSVEYFTKCGERKRFFRSTKDYLKVNLIKQYKEVQKELKIAEKIGEFNQKYNKLKHRKYKEIGKLYKKYLETQHQNLEQTIEKMNHIEQDSLE